MGYNLSTENGSKVIMQFKLLNYPTYHTWNIWPFLCGFFGASNSTHVIFCIDSPARNSETFYARKLLKYSRTGG